jgi:hypothetical protein
MQEEVPALDQAVRGRTAERFAAGRSEVTGVVLKFLSDEIDDAALSAEGRRADGGDVP